MTSEKKIKKAAIWGTGQIAQMHAMALKANGVKLVAVVDINQKAVEKFAQKWKIKNYSNDKRILFDQDIDTVHVCSPPNLHYRMVKELLEHNKNVICEKPLCFSTKEAEELAKMAKKRNLKCIVNFNVRYHYVIEQIKNHLDSQKFGKINLIHGKYLQSYHLLPLPYSWRYNPNLAGPMRAITEIGTHLFDLIQYLSGEKIIKILAKFGNFNPVRYLENQIMYQDSSNLKEKEQKIKIDSEDAALIMFELNSKAIGSIVLSEVSHGSKNLLEINFTGQNGSISWNSEQNNQFNFAYGTNNLETQIEPFGNGFNQTFAQIIGDFYEHKNLSKLPTIEQASYIVKICNAAYKSNKNQGKWINLEGNNFV